ncbi:MAG: isoaspartyl peptidase/L-asparaginase [Candidatus Hodarchaeales archaeon]|jgi:beta-aspartyl-peptidase (threonine type)
MASLNSFQSIASPAIIVHGGAWNIPDEMKDKHLYGVIDAVKTGYHTLQNQGSALDAVEKAVVCMENNSIFDAGIGSFLNEEGIVELDALIINGNTLDAGSIGAVHCCQNPIVLARRLMEISHSPMMLVGRGADLFARKTGLSCDPKELIVPRELSRWEENKREFDIFTPDQKGTVGAVALDRKGNLASATSTGGSPFKMVGRIGDTPILGSGGYANQFAAVSSTGHGESFMKINAAKLATDLVEQGYSPTNAAKVTIGKIADIKGYGGIIIVNRKGDIGYFFNTSRMAYASISNTGELISGIDSI